MTLRPLLSVAGMRGGCKRVAEGGVLRRCDFRNVQIVYWKMVTLNSIGLFLGSWQGRDRCVATHNLTVAAI